MTKRISIALFVTFLLAFCSNWILQKNGIHIPLIHSYMDDLICVPVILFPFLFMYKKWVNDSVLPISYIILTCVTLSVIFEFILPTTSNHHISDSIDIVLYAAGGGLFYYMQKPFGYIKPITVNR